MIGSCNCPITANGPNTTLQINELEQHTSVCTLTFEGIATVMIDINDNSFNKTQR